MNMTDSTASRIRPASQRRPFRYRTQAILIAAFAGYAVLSWMILKSSGNPPIRFRIDISHLVDASFMVKLHLAGALTAFVIGAILLRGVKGTGLHRKLGYSWVAAMTLAAVSSFFLVGLNGNHYSLIHGLSAWTIVVLPMAVVAARRKNIRKHAKGMTNLFLGGLLVAGLFAFLPGRMLWSIFFAV
ncbi:MAG: DUF2306 domain-containing protein [Hyphomonas sp.]|nr:DUF2306 domain-containing protein [Hyphomonas sp.]